MDTQSLVDSANIRARPKRSSLRMPLRKRKARDGADSPVTPEAHSVVLALSISDAARAAGVSRTLLYPYLDADYGIPTFTIGKRRLIRIDALREFLLRREQEAPR